MKKAALEGAAKSDSGRSYYLLPYRLYLHSLAGSLQKPCLPVPEFSRTIIVIERPGYSMAVIIRLCGKSLFVFPGSSCLLSLEGFSATVALMTKIGLIFARTRCKNIRNSFGRSFGLTAYTRVQRMTFIIRTTRTRAPDKINEWEEVIQFPLS